MKTFSELMSESVGVSMRKQDTELFRKITGGKTDSKGNPDLTGVTLCDLFKLSLKDFGNVMCLFGQAPGYEQTKWWANGPVFSQSLDQRISSNDASIRTNAVWRTNFKGYYRAESMVMKFRYSYGMAFGDELLQNGKSEVIGMYRQIKDCKDRAAWAKGTGGLLYRGKQISWKQFKAMKWKPEGKNLVATGTYKSKYGMQSWTTRKDIAKQFGEGLQTGVFPELIFKKQIGKDGKPNKEVTGGKIAVVLEAIIPSKDCVFTPAASNYLNKVLAIGGDAGDFKEWEVLRVSTEPVKVKFTAYQTFGADAKLAGFP